MKIHLLSDLHLEFGSFNPPETDADVVVLAGDIHIKGRAVDWALKAFTKPVIFVPGNHDYYGGSTGHTLAKMRDAARGTHVHVLNDEAVTIGDTRFLGCTLWTDYRLTGNEPLAQWDAQQTLHDFKVIRDEQFRKIRPYQLAAYNQRSRNFLESKLDEPFAGKTVVVTHHAPTELSIAERYRQKGEHLNAAFASRLDHLMGGERVALWMHGHTHDNFDYDVYGTRVVCNPRGYAGEDLNEDFNPSLVLEV
jgi:Icc-related predicted phosphoesterase